MCAQFDTIGYDRVTDLIHTCESNETDCMVSYEVSCGPFFFFTNEKTDYERIRKKKKKVLFQSMRARLCIYMCVDWEFNATVVVISTVQYTYCYHVWSRFFLLCFVVVVYLRLTKIMFVNMNIRLTQIHISIMDRLVLCVFFLFFLFGLFAVLIILLRALLFFG